MNIIEAIVLAFIQGVTEFLPVSSSAHLILPSQILGWADQGLAFDVAVHVGSLIAVLVYFRKDISDLIAAWLQSVALKKHTETSKEAWVLFCASLPAIAVGFFINDYIEPLRSTFVIAMTSIVFALLLAFADQTSGNNCKKSVSLQYGVIIGVMQCLAFIPGTSRSGITMTTALLLGMTKKASARFSFLLSIPIIAGAGMLKMIELLQYSESVDWLVLAIASVVSFISAYICIKVFLDVIQKLGFMPFVIYRILLGVVLLMMINL